MALRAIGQISASIQQKPLIVVRSNFVCSSPPLPRPGSCALPRIADEYLDCVSYLYPSISDAEEGARRGGTAFLVAMPFSSGGGLLPYLITNRHIIENGNTVVRLNKRDGKVECIETDERLWTFHPAGDDLAALPFLYDPRQVTLLWLPFSKLLTREIIAAYDIGLGDEAFVVGRFVNHEGREKNLPTVRFGNIAQMPWEPIRDRRASGPFYQDSYLVEIRSIGGYSGSPVFVHILPGSIRRVEGWVDKILSAHGPWLLGVNWAHMNDYMPAKEESGRELSFKVQSNSGMMAVVPSWKVAELLESTALAQQREELLRNIPSFSGAPDANE